MCLNDHQFLTIIIETPSTSLECSGMSTTTTTTTVEVSLIGSPTPTSYGDFLTTFDNSMVYYMNIMIQCT